MNQHPCRLEVCRSTLSYPAKDLYYRALLHPGLIKALEGMFEEGSPVKILFKSVDPRNQNQQSYIKPLRVGVRSDIPERWREVSVDPYDSIKVSHGRLELVKQSCTYTTKNLQRSEKCMQHFFRILPRKILAPGPRAFDAVAKLRFSGGGISNVGPYIRSTSSSAVKDYLTAR